MVGAAPAGAYRTGPSGVVGSRPNRL